MSVHPDLTTSRRCADGLCRSVERSARQPGDDPDVRRAGTGAGQLQESITLLRDAATATTPLAARSHEPVMVPQDPYDSSLWTNTDGLDDEGLGAQGRHAP